MAYNLPHMVSLRQEQNPIMKFAVPFLNTSLAAPGELAHRLQRRTACNTSPPTLSKMADGVWKEVKS